MAWSGLKELLEEVDGWSLPGRRDRLASLGMDTWAGWWDYSGHENVD